MVDLGLKSVYNIQSIFQSGIDWPFELYRSMTLKLTNENPQLSDQLRSVRFTVCDLWINIIELNQWNILWISYRSPSCNKN